MKSLCFCEMRASQLDPDVVRWGLQDLRVCDLTNSGSFSTVTKYQTDSCTVEYVREGYINVENDAFIAKLYQEELSRVAEAEASGSTDPGQASIVSQQWPHSHLSKEDQDTGQENQGKADDDSSENKKEMDFCDTKDGIDLRTENRGGENSCAGNNSSAEDDLTIEIVEDCAALDGEVGKRFDQMVPVPHVPRINGEVPSEDEEISDHQRLLCRLELYGLVENKVQGDGNCQFRSLSDQLYRSSEHHKFVREQVVHQLKCHPEIYEGYVPMAYNDYLKKMSRNGEWGDHVTMQAAADWFGVRIFLITSFKDTCYVEILPHVQKSNRLICLSFWAEVHYNSIYPEGELAPTAGKKKKKWWGL